MICQPVDLTFFCELDGETLERLFSDPSVTDLLVQLGGRVSLGIVDFSARRAAVVRRLNRVGIPLIAWQLLPRGEGYWYNMCNAPQAAARYARFLEWTEREGLQWSAVGVDIEPDIGEFQQLLTRKGRLLRSLWSRGCGIRRFCDASAAYHSLVLRMQADGYPVHSYEFPFMVDEQRAGSTLLRRLLGVTDVPSDQRVLMLYTSFFRPFGPSFLWSYAKEVSAVGVGITGGGVELEGVRHPDPLSWEEFSRDLRLAACRCADIHVFSLEGCVQQGFLRPLLDFDWDLPVQPPRSRAALLNALRTVLQALLWLVSRPLLLVGILAVLLGLWAL